MFKADSVTLCNGAIYDNVTIHDAVNHPNIFEDYTVVIGHSNNIFYVHETNISIIHLNKFEFDCPNCIEFSHIVMLDDTIYGPGRIIPARLYAEYDIPTVCIGHSQLVFTCKDGTLIAPDINVISVTLLNQSSAKMRCGRKSTNG